MHIKCSMDNFTKISTIPKGCKYLFGYREDTDLAQLNSPCSNSGITIKIHWHTTLSALKNSQDFLAKVFLVIFVQLSHLDTQAVTIAPSLMHSDGKSYSFSPITLLATEENDTTSIQKKWDSKNVSFSTFLLSSPKTSPRINISSQLDK